MDSWDGFPLRCTGIWEPKPTGVLQVIWHLTVLNNVTRLGVDTGPKLRLRHGLAMEHDALITTVVDSNGRNLDLIGRSVVLAFRLASIKTDFPNILTQREIVDAVSNEESSTIHFKKLRLSSENRLRYFKGEKFGTGNLYASTERKYKKQSKNAVLSTVDKAIAAAENPQSDSTPVDSTVLSLIHHLQSGPDWTREVLKDYLCFVRDDVLGSLNKAKSFLESSVGR